jgi:phosphatidylcholine synthase
VILAWGVHLFTASGAVIAALALLAIIQERWETAGLLMLAALFIDSVDGTLARRVGVAEVVPRIDGRRLDDVVDFLGYAIVPTVFLLALNVVALYIWLLEIGPGLATAIVSAFALAVFVPLKYIYPSKLTVWRGVTTIGALVWGAFIVAALLFPERAERLHLLEISLVYPAYYMGLSAWLGGWLRVRR